jgi:hypothetical protein
MARLLTTNMAATILGGSIGGTSDDTTITLATGTGALFPALPHAGDYFHGVLVNSAGQSEIVKVTARSTDSLTVVRGQEGTTIRAFSAADRFELRLTAADIEFIQSSYWSRESAVVARVDGTQFTVVGDQTLRYVQYRSVHAIQTTSAYGFVVSSSYSGGTGLTTVVVEGLTIDAGLVAMEYGQDPTSAPKYASYPAGSESVAGILQLATNAEALAGTNNAKSLTPEDLSYCYGKSIQAFNSNACFRNVSTGYSSQHYPTPVTLISASTIAFDNALTAYASVTLGESATLGDPSNKVDGQAGELIVTGASTYTLGVHSNWKMANGTAVALAPVDGKKTWIFWECNGTYNSITAVIQEA